MNCTCCLPELAHTCDCLGVIAHAVAEGRTIISWMVWVALSRSPMVPLLGVVLPCAEGPARQAQKDKKEKLRKKVDKFS